MHNLYLSFDIEADGDVPSLSNMLSIGIVAFDKKGNEVSSFQRNIKPRTDPRYAANERCKREFWDKQPDLSEWVATNAVTPEQAIGELAFWLAGLDENVAWIARPAAYDWQWLKAYYEQYKPRGAPKLDYTATCISTLWKVYCHKYGIEGDENKRVTWTRLSQGKPHTHNPEDDAREQGIAFFEIVKDLGWLEATATA